MTDWGWNSETFWWEQDKNDNSFCIAHPSLSIASFRSLLGEWLESESAFVQFQFIFFAEIVCNTINFGLRVKYAPGKGTLINWISTKGQKGS